MREQLQKIGKSLMMPISIIAAAGIFLGLSSVLQNANIVGEAFVSLSVIQNIVGFIRADANALFGNLSILFAISVAIGLARKEKETAAFSAVIGFIVFHIAISTLLGFDGLNATTTSVSYLMDNGASQIDAYNVFTKYETILGIFTLRMNVLGGIVVGLIVSWLHNRFHEIELPVVISFFGGKRFVPIITTIVLPLAGIVFYWIWPFFGSLIDAVGGFIASSGVFGTFMFGFLERLLVPTGLHHILNQLVRFTPIGGTQIIAGETIVGSLNIFNTYLAQGSTDFAAISEATRFLAQGKIPFMVFGLPAACYAIYKTAYVPNKERVKGLTSASGLASFTTGITEPIEFSFIFVAPLLYLFHAFMAGLSFMLMDIFNVAIGNVQGGVIDLVVFGVLQGTGTNWYFAVIVGVFYAVIYYVVFKYVIERFALQTPGREDDSIETHVVIQSELGIQIIDALGGKENISEIDNCFTRLRLVLKDNENIDEAALKLTGAIGVVKVGGQSLQVIYGPQVEKIAQLVKEAR